MSSTYYRVYLTPRTALTTYGTEVEITKYVYFDGLGSIRRVIDANDYDFGAFTYDDLQLKVDNLNGYFNDETDWRSAFKFSRDLAKVRVLFTNTDGDTITFRGLINEEATRQDLATDQIEFRVLSLGSVIRNTAVSGGTVANGVTVKTALQAILNVPKITSVLTYSVGNINPDNNFAIDLGSKFDNKSTRDVLNSLLLASNSVFLVDEDQNMIVRSRAQDTTTDVLNLYGPFNIHGRQNIISVSNYNTGRHRMFTAVRVNNTEEKSSGYSEQFGYRQKHLTLDFVTTAATEAAVATRLLTEFKSPKIELSVTVATSVARDIQLLQRVSVDYPLRVLRSDGCFLPVIGSAVIADSVTALPRTFGGLSIDPVVAFKVIEISEDPVSFQTTLKLRQLGTGTQDGYFNDPALGIVGYAVIGISPIGGTGDSNGNFNPSVIGAARIGSTEVA